MVGHRPQKTLPSKEDILGFIATQSGKVGTREIARAFGLKNADRAELKAMLRELEDDGRVDRKRKKLHHPGMLPDVVLAEVTTRDRDGELIAVPADWDADTNGEAPRIRIHVPRRARPGEIPGIGDRALLRTEDVGAEDMGAEDGIRYRGRVVKLIGQSRNRVIGVFRALPDGGGRLVPIEKKNVGRELAIASGRTLDAQDGDLIAVEVQRHGRFGTTSAQVKERLGSVATEKAVSMIAPPCARHPPRLPARGAAGGGDGAAGRPYGPRGLA